MSNTVNDPREKFYSDISLKKSHIKLRPPTVLIFGGKIDVTDINPLSVREKIVEYTENNCPNLSSSTIIPENFKDWASDANYSDLLEFETHIAQMSTKIVLIPESPGSIAELGAFVVNTRISQKLMIILPTEYVYADSFINLGLLRQLDEKQVFAYEYPAKNFSLGIDKCIKDIVFDIQNQANSGDETEAYDEGNFGHFCFCIFQLVLDCQALGIIEIESLTATLGVKRERADLKRALYLLERLGFVRQARFSNYTFYVTCKSDSRVSYRGQDHSKHIDVLSFKMELAQFLSDTPNERPRCKAIEQLKEAQNS